LPPPNLTADDVRQLYDRYSRALLAYACSFVPDVAAAEDILHQVFLQLLKGNTPAPDEPRAYLYRALRNAALNALRNGHRELAHGEGSGVKATALFEHRGGDQDAALAVQAALRELPAEQREVVTLKIWTGMTLEEIAALSGIPANTAASRYRYALEKLRERLKAHYRS
jgi:RNA polymerase sigma-70 factor, ECF subfamily